MGLCTGGGGGGACRVVNSWGGGNFINIFIFSISQLRPYYAALFHSCLFFILRFHLRFGYQHVGIQTLEKHEKIDLYYTTLWVKTQKLLACFLSF